MDSPIGGPGRVAPGAGRTLLAALLDQGSTGVASLLLVIAVARSTDLARFGYFAIAAATIQIGLQLARASGTEPLLVVREAPDFSGSGEAEAAAMRAVLVRSVAILPLGVAYMLVLRVPVLFVLSLLALPASAVVDGVRMVGVARREPIRAAMSGMPLVVLTICSAAFVLQASVIDNSTLCWVLLLPPVIAVPFAYVIMQIRPTFSRSTYWRLVTRRLSRSYVLEALASQGFYYFALAVVTLSIGPAGAGSFRLVQAAFGPLHVVVAGVRTYFQPSFRADRTSPGTRPRALRVSQLLVAAAFLSTSMLLLMPTPILEAAFGEVPHLFRVSVALAGMAKLCECAGVGAFLLLRANHQAVRILLFRLCGGVLGSLALVPLVAVLGERGAWLALCVGAAVTMVLSWRGLPAASEPLVAQRPSIAVVSHAYLDPEVFKNLCALASWADVALITPHTGLALVADRSASELPFCDGVKVISHPVVRPKMGTFVFRSLRLGMPRDVDSVVIEYDPWSPVFWQCLVARLLRAPDARVVLMVKKNTFREGPRAVAAVKSALATASRPFVHDVMAASEKAAQLYRTRLLFPSARVTVVPHLGVDVTVFRPRIASLATSTVVFGFVGTLSQRKGADLLLDAYMSLSDISSIKLVLVGPWALPSEFDRSNYPSVTFRSVVDSGSIWEEYLRFDVLVQPTRIESDHEEHDGRSVAEGMCCGLPVIASRSGVYVDLVSPKTGQLVRPGDVAELADAMRSLISEASKRDEMGQEAREFSVQNLSIEAVAAAKLRIILPGLDLLKNNSNEGRVP